MTEVEIETRPLPALRLAARTTRVDGPGDVPGVIGAMFDAAADAITAAGGTPGTPVAVHEMDADGLHVVAGSEHDGEAPGAEVVQVPARGPGALHHPPR